MSVRLTSFVQLLIANIKKRNKKSNSTPQKKWMCERKKNITDNHVDRLSVLVMLQELRLIAKMKLGTLLLWLILVRSERLQRT